MATSEAKQGLTAVIKTGGKQYLVAEGDKLAVEKIGDEKTASFVPLLVTKDGKVSTGSGKVTAKVLGPVKGEKLTVFKMKSKKGYRRKAGHRQHLTEIQIDKITA